MINCERYFQGICFCRWKNDIFYDNTKADIVISVVFMQNEDLVVAYWNSEQNQEVVCPDQNISAENCFHLPPIFQDVIKRLQRRVYFRVVMQQPWLYSAKQNLTFSLLC